MDAGAGMHYHPGGLIDRDQIVVFIQDAERDVFRFGAQRRRVGGLHLDGVFSTNQVRSPALGTVDAHAPAPNPLLDARPAEFRQAFVDHLIEPFAGIARFGD